MNPNDVPMIYRRDTTSTEPKGRKYLITTNEPSVNEVLSEIRTHPTAVSSSPSSSSPSNAYPSSPTTCSPQHLPKYVENDKKVLAFQTYFLEPVYESSIENYRVRFCQMLYYLEDDTIQVIEKKTENSGLAHGTLVKRQKVPHPDEYATNGEFITYHWKELNVQSTIRLYGRMYRIIDADDFTRTYYQTHHHTPLAEKEEKGKIPEDIYTKLKDVQMSRETGKETNRNYGKIQYPMKQYLEASLGKSHHSSEQTRRFLQYDRQVLRWYCSWDDSNSAFGQKHYYMIHYYLTDNTLEVKEIHERNSGYDALAKLLGRQRLEKKDTNETRRHETNKEDDQPAPYYEWKDFQIGRCIDVYNRPLLLLDADQSTREWYKENGKEIHPYLEEGKFAASSFTK